MTVLEKFIINDEPDIIYAKRTLKNMLKIKKNNKEDFLVFCLVELSTNLIKHANGGEILVLNDKSNILLCSFDFGDGIEDIAWSMQNSTSQKEGSLGVGLYQMNNNSENYKIEIASFRDKDIHGTVVLLKPIDYKPHISSIQMPYITEKFNGDLFAEKGKFLLLADGVGHGKKAHNSVEFIKSYFYKHPFSSLLVDEFFTNIHNSLKSNNLRGAVIAICEISKDTLRSYGVGNISFWHQRENSYKYISQKDEVLGDFFSSSDKKVFNLAQNQKLIMTTDGVDINKMAIILKMLPINCDASLMLLCIIHFASLTLDDKTVVIITNKETKL